MLAGRVAFFGETVSDTIAAILERSRIGPHYRPTTPTSIRRLLERCLDKDPKRRVRDIGDARLELEDGLTSGIGSRRRMPTAHRKRRRVGARCRGLDLCCCIGNLRARALCPLWSGALDVSSFRFIPVAAEPADETSPSWSPDGKSIVYVSEIDGVKQLFTRSLDSAVSTQITKASTDCLSPFWSPTALASTSPRTSSSDRSGLSELRVESRRWS